MDDSLILKTIADNIRIERLRKRLSQEKLAEIDAEFDPKAEQISQQKSMLEADIKAEVLQAGQTVKGTFHSFVWSKPRVSWDTKALDGYAAAQFQRWDSWNRF